MTNVRPADVRSSQSLAEKYYEWRTNDFFSKGTTDSAWTDREVHYHIDIWPYKKFRLSWNQLNETTYFRKTIAEEMSRAGYNKTGEQCR